MLYMTLQILFVNYEGNWHIDYDDRVQVSNGRYWTFKKYYKNTGAGRPKSHKNGLFKLKLKFKYKNKQQKP